MKTFIRFSCNVESSFSIQRHSLLFLLFFSHSLLRFNKLFFIFVCNLYVNAIKASVYKQNANKQIHTHTHTWNGRKILSLFNRIYSCNCWETFGWRVNEILDCAWCLFLHFFMIPCCSYSVH